MSTQLETTLIVAIITALFTLLLQKSFANVIMGLNIKLRRLFKVNDKVTVLYNGLEVASEIVTAIKINKVLIESYDKDIHIIPASVLDKCVVINSNFTDGMNYTNTMKFTLDSNIAKIKFHITTELNNHDITKNSNQNTRILVSYDEGQLKVQYNIRTKTIEDSYVACSDICENLIKIFENEEDIHLI